MNIDISPVIENHTIIDSSSYILVVLKVFRDKKTRKRKVFYKINSKNGKRFVADYNDFFLIDPVKSGDRFINKVMSVPNFDPSGKIFCFRLDHYDCFKANYGTCSLELTNEQRAKYPNASKFDESGVDYCPKLYQSLRRQGVRKGFYLYKDSCGHYSVDSGQHRICICGRKRIQVYIEKYCETNSLCSVCYEKNKFTYSHPILSKFLKKKLTDSHYVLYELRESIEKKSKLYRLK